MADMMQFDLVSPERSLVSGEIRSVQIPGAEGDLTAMAHHAPLVTTLRPGVLTVAGPDGDDQYVVTGGFAEITGAGTTILAERAYPKSAEHRSAIEDHIEEAKQAAADAAPAEKDAAEKFLADLVRLLDQME